MKRTQLPQSEEGVLMTSVQETGVKPIKLEDSTCMELVEAPGMKMVSIHAKDLALKEKDEHIKLVCT